LNAFDIEALRQNLLVNLPVKYGKSKVFLFYEFYFYLLNSSDNALIEAYSLEFIEDYINSVQHYNPYCLPPARTAGLINQLKEISSLSSVNNFERQIKKEIERIGSEFNNLESILYGNKKDEQSRNMLSFPLIEESAENNKNVYGFLETVRVTVNKSKGENKLYVFPNKGELEKNLEKQIKDSFLLAINYLKNFKIKFHDYHEIIVYFDNFSANYIGNSLGIALAIGFIEQLTILYNLPFLVNIKNNIASTGGINSDGDILSITKEYIERKVEVVFYSSIEIFIVSKEDEQYANEKLIQLRSLYPQRNLKIIGVSDLDDIINRRNLINILKQNPLVRSIKASVKNWQVTLLIAILYIIIAITLFRSFDNNPAILENHGKILLVKNKSGKILWTKRVGYDPLLFKTEYNLESLQRIIDIDNNGTNEVILTNESAEELKSLDYYGRAASFNSEGKIIWSFGYKDSIPGSGKSLNPLYSTVIIDTFSIKNEKFILLCASNRSSNTSVIIKINRQNGKRIGGVLKHNGLIYNTLIFDFNNDGIKEAGLAAVNKQFEKAALGIIDLSDLTGRCPASNNSTDNNIPYAHLISYILLPKNIYDKQKVDGNEQIKLKDIINNPAEHCIYLSVVEDDNPSSVITFKVNYDWQTIDIIVKNDINNLIDSSTTAGKLTSHNFGKGKLNELFKNDIMFWNGKDFVGGNK
jgi:hypothetical protein